MGKTKIGDTPLSWVAIYGAIVGTTSMVPLIPYASGGGYLPLSIPLICLAPLLLGIKAGIVSAFIGGLIGMLIAPSAYPMGIFDVFFVAVSLAIFVSLSVNGNIKKYWILFLLIFISQGILAEVIPYYIPGISAGFEEPPQPTYTIVVTAVWLPWFLIYLILGMKHIPKWIRSDDKKLKYIGAFLGITTGLMCWALIMIYPYLLVLKLPPEVGTILWVYDGILGRSITGIIATILLVPLSEALERSNLQPPSGVIWKQK